RRQHLSEFVVELARNLPERGLPGRNELLRQLAAIVGQRRQAREQLPVRTNQIETRQRDDDEGRGEKDVDLPLHLRVNVAHPGGGLFFGRVVGDEQPRDRRIQRVLPRLQRKPDLLARLGFVPAAGEREDAVGGVPELRERSREVLGLLRRPAAARHLGFARDGAVEIPADARELRRPRRQRIRLAALEHVAHRQGERVEVVL